MSGEFLFRSRWILRLLLVSFWEDVSLPILEEASLCGVVWRGYVGAENRLGFRRRGRIEAVTVKRQRLRRTYLRPILGDHTLCTPIFDPLFTRLQSDSHIQIPKFSDTVPLSGIDE